MNEEEKLKEDVLFDVDMQLYNEFNDKLCEINEHLGDIYSYKDLDDVEKAEKEIEIKLLREAIKKLQKEIENYQILKDDIEEHNVVYVDTPEFEENYVSKDKIKEIISKYVDIEEHLVYHHEELWGVDLAEMIKELLGE